MSGFSSRVRLQVRKRAGSGYAGDACCEACGVWLGEHGGQIQHRDARGMGGSSDPVTNSVVNAGLLCGTPLDKNTCHGAAEDRNDEMNKRGWWLRNGQDPALTSVVLFGDVEVWLTPEGGYSNEPPAEEAA